MTFSGADVMALLIAILPLLIAVVTDLRRREVPDAVPLAILALALGHHWFADPPGGWGGFLLGGLFAGVVSAIGFYAGALGGGDVKLLATLGALLGLEATFVLLVLSAMVGGMLCLLAWRRGDKEVAYVPAIAAGYGGVLALALATAT